MAELPSDEEIERMNKENEEGVKKFASELILWLSGAIKEMISTGDVVGAWEELHWKYHLIQNQKDMVEEVYFPHIKEQTEMIKLVIIERSLEIMEETPSVWEVMI